MSEAPVPLLSDLIADQARSTREATPGTPVPLVLGPAITGPSSRRGFLARASALSLALPGVGAALAACAPDESGTAARDSVRDTTAANGTGGLSQDSLRHHNSNSKLDSAVLGD